MSLQNRINELLNESPEKKAIDLARFVKVSRASVSAWVNGKTKTIEGENAFAVAKFFGVNPEWVQTGKGTKRPISGVVATELQLRGGGSDGYATPRIPDGTARALPVFDAPIEPGDEYLPIKVVSFKLQAGIVGYAVEYLDEDDNDPIYFRADWVIKHGYKHERLLAFKVKGESMTPKLYSGDLVVINTDDSQAKDGKVFAVNYEGEMVIKRMVRDGGQWWLASDNADKTSYPNKLCAGDYCIVIGRVVYRQTQEI